MRPGNTWLLSAAIAAVSLGVWQGPAQAASAPESSDQTSLKALQFIDVAPNHWAYQAIQQIVDKYRIMSGYPDRTFRGNQVLTRYDLAATLNIVMQRFMAMENQGTPATPDDTAMVGRLKDEFKVELVNLNNRLVTVETQTKGLDAAIADLKAKMGAGDKVHGTIGTTVEDDPEDRLKPYVISNFEVRFGSDIDENTSYSASISGGQPAAASGGTPVFTRGKAVKDRGLPNGNITLGTNAQITTKIPGGTGTVKAGYFTPGSFIGLGGLAHHYGDGVIGSGLMSPAGNTVRTGGAGEDIGVGTKLSFGNLKLGAGVNTQFAFGGMTFTMPGLAGLSLIADMDHNSIGNVNLEGDPTWRVSSGINLGSDQLGLTLQAGITSAGQKYTPKAGLNFITTLAEAELCLGAAYRTDPDGQTIEIIPTGYVYYPSKGWMPSILVGAREPETVSAANGSSGPGSLLGNKAGWTVQLGIPQPILPQLTLELNMQSNVLLGNYDGFGYAITTSTDF